MKESIGILLLLVLMVGCATGSWVKEGVTEQQHRRDLYECKRDAAMVQDLPRHSGLLS